MHFQGSFTALQGRVEGVVRTTINRYQVHGLDIQQSGKMDTYSWDRQLRIKRQYFVWQACLTEEFAIKQSYTGQSGRPA